LIFADDAKQAAPTRKGVGPLVAAGAVMLDADLARSAEKALNSLCSATGFPDGDEFKWSPRRGTWMYNSLHAEKRQQFFLDAIQVLVDHSVLAHVVMEDSNRSRATNPDLSAEDDVVVLLLERLANRLKEMRTTGLLVADRPGGDRPHEDRFIADCLRALDAGTLYVQHAEISFVISTDSRIGRNVSRDGSFSMLIAVSLRTSIRRSKRYVSCAPSARAMSAVLRSCCSPAATRKLITKRNSGG
jgi:hypothetical protein